MVDEPTIVPSAQHGAETPASPHMTSPSTPTTLQSTPRQQGTSAASTTDDGPKRFQSLADIYATAGEVELDFEELLLAAEEPENYRKATTEKAWQEAMKSELEAIKKKKDMGAYRLASRSQVHWFEVGVQAKKKTANATSSSTKQGWWRRGTCNGNVSILWRSSRQ